MTSAEALTRFATDIFTHAGLPQADAAIISEVLVWANLRGVDTHGVMRVPRYVDLIENGDMNPRPAICIRTETAASVLIEADRAAGPVAMMRGVSEALRKARDAGIGLALVRATTHTAALGYYTLAIAREAWRDRPRGILAQPSITVARRAYRRAHLIAVPGGDPVVLDMATSIARWAS
jgi:ureidoglycolate dehydrogenase (NAD+)